MSGHVRAVAKKTVAVTIRLMASGTGTLTIERPSAWRDRIRKYRIVVDGEGFGTVGNGQTVTFEVAAGVHRLQARISWTGSEEVAIDVPAGGATRLRVEPAGSAMTAFFQALTRSRYLRISVLVGGT
jgi:hypothetical protein